MASGNDLKHVPEAIGRFSEVQRGHVQPTCESEHRIPITSGRSCEVLSVTSERPCEVLTWISYSRTSVCIGVSGTGPPQTPRAHCANKIMMLLLWVYSHGDFWRSTDSPVLIGTTEEKSIHAAFSLTHTALAGSATPTIAVCVYFWQNIFLHNLHQYIGVNIFHRLSLWWSTDTNQVVKFTIESP